MQFQPLLKWYALNKRELPWRQTDNPYFIWISEVILQQTRVEQGLPYYYKFIEKFPDVKKLAVSPQETLFKTWQGLGYYSRAANLQTAARQILEVHKGKFPGTYNELIRLKGVGPYTAAAVSSIAYGEARAVLDGNVSRVLSRLFAVKLPVNSTKGKTILQSLADEILDRKHPGEFNQALMELGALICTPRQPQCPQCPMAFACEANRTDRVSSFPKKTPKKQPKTLFLNFAVFLKAGKTYIHLRNNKGIWKNLYEPPVIESETEITYKQLLNNLTNQDYIRETKGKANIEMAYETKHQLTHRTIYARFWILRNLKPLNLSKHQLIETETTALHRYPVHRLFDKFLNYYNLHDS